MNPLNFNLGLTPSRIRECVFTLGKYDKDLSETYSNTINLLGEIIVYIVKEMTSVDRDLNYWKILIECSSFEIALIMLNGRWYRFLQSIFHGRKTIEIEWNDQEDIEYKISIIRSMQRKLACLLGTLHKLSYYLMTIYSDVKFFQAVSVETGSTDSELRQHQYLVESTHKNLSACLDILFNELTKFAIPHNKLIESVNSIDDQDWSYNLVRPASPIPKLSISEDSENIKELYEKVKNFVNVLIVNKNRDVSKSIETL